MIGVRFIRVLLFGALSSLVLAEMLPSVRISPISTNCSASSQPCGPVPSCCTAGLQCNYRRGIPICQNPTENYISGFNPEPCADPYLFRCDLDLGISGFCCPIGTSCFNHGDNNVIQCIDAYGTTASSIPSATTGLLPTSTPVLGNSHDIIYSPAAAWSISNVNDNCSISESLHVTNTINATVSFNFTGPNIMVHTITSSNGGVFSVWVDGFNTTYTIDTFSGPGNKSLPLCYPLQFPPFVVTPPGYQSRENHTITIFFIGPSPEAPEGTNTSNFQFDAFAIPNANDLLALTSHQGSAGQQNSNGLFQFVLMLIAIYAII